MLVIQQRMNNYGAVLKGIHTTGVRDPYGRLVGGTGTVERRFTHDAMRRVTSETDSNGYEKRS